MSATQATVTSTQVAVRYRRNVGSLSIDMSADCRTTTLGRYIDRHINRDIGRYLDRYSTDMSVDLSTDTSRSIYRPSVFGHVDRHIGRALVDMLTDTRPICRPIYRSRGAQNGMVWYTLFKSKKHASPNNTQLVSMEGVFVQT